MKKDKAIFKPVERLSRPRWKWSPLAAFALAVGLFCGSCGQIKYIPTETNTEVHYVDSTILHIKDSIRIHEATRYKDFSWIGDTLKLNGNRSRAWAVADTTKEVLIGGLEEDKVEEHSKVIYKDRWKVRDSLVYVEKPIPVEVTKEVRIVPRFWRVMGVFGIISLVILAVFLFFKVRAKIGL